MRSSGNLGEFILSQTDKFGEKAAFVVKTPERVAVSFAEFNQKVREITAYLSRTYGNKKHFKIGLWSENRLEWCALALATWRAGGVVVPLMHIATLEEVKRIIGAAHMQGLFISGAILKSQNVQTQDLAVDDVFVMSLETKNSVTHLKTLGQLLSEKNLSKNFDGVSEPTKLDDLAVLIFTSGTTGHPKGVMLTHDNLITNIENVMNVVPCDETDRAISVLPLSHMFELIAGFAIVHVKGITISYPDSLKSEDVLSEMREAKATMMAAVPLLFEIMDRTIQERIAQLPTLLKKILLKAGPLVRKYPFLGKIIFKRVHAIFGGHMRYFFTGGAKIDSEVILRFQSLGIQMLQGYGLTETSPIISFTRAESLKYTSVGQPIKTLSIKIDSPNAEGDGEICVKGPSVFKGYFENPEATAETFKDGWFHTGDLGHLDSENYIYITGRKKDMIVTPNGKNVYPEELEEILKTSNKFAEVSVLGIESGRGESVHAVVVPTSKDPVDITKEKIWHEINRLTADISEYKKIQGLSVTFDELPKTPTKKVKKHLLRAMIKEGKFDRDISTGGTALQKSALDNTSERELWLGQKLAQISKRPEIWREADLKQDLSIDSLTFMEVISQLETKWGLHIPDEDFEKLKTVGDLANKLNIASGTDTESGAGTGKLTGSYSQGPRSESLSFDFHENNTVFMNTLRILIHGLLVRPLLKIFFRFRVTNRQFLKDRGNFVLTPNHSSHFDLITILSSIPLSNLNKTYAVAAEDYFFNTAFKSRFVRLVFNAIPFDRKARVEKGFKICEDILRDGGNLVIFPEGTRAVDGKLTSFKAGVGRLLAGHPYLAIPSHINGAYEVFPKGASLPRLHPLSVRFGKPRDFNALKPDLGAYQTVASTLHSAVVELRDQSPV